MPRASKLETAFAYYWDLFAKDLADGPVEQPIREQVDLIRGRKFRADFY